MWTTHFELIRQQHAFIDLFTRGWISDYRGSGGMIHCRMGCSGCCNLTVNATFAEAVLVAQGLTEGQASSVRAHVEFLRECASQAGSLVDFLRLHRSPEGICPFLDRQGACGIYRDRPFSCRSLLSTMESRWCAADFTALSPDEKGRFISSLDRNAVAFPLHYVAALQELGREMEIASKNHMRKSLGFSLYGNFPALVLLARDYDVTAACSRGAGTIGQLIAAAGVDHTFLTSLEVTSGTSHDSP